MELVGGGMVTAFGAVVKVKVFDSFSTTIVAVEGLGKFTDVSSFGTNWMFS